MAILERELTTGIDDIAGKYANGKFAPAPGSTDHARYLYWFHFAEGSAMPPLLLKLYFSRVVPAPPPVLERINAQIASQLDYMDSELSKSAYFAGAAFTAADIQMSFPVIGAASRGGLDASRPHLWRWLSDVRQRPAFLRANERGGALQLP